MPVAPTWLKPIGRVFPAVVIERTGFPRLTSASIAAMQIQMQTVAEAATAPRSPENAAPSGLTGPAYAHVPTCVTPSYGSIACTNGPSGPNGLDGINGLDGPNGIDGLNGLDGLHGPNGLDGPNGLSGLHGLDGLSGPYGLPMAVPVHTDSDSDTECSESTFSAISARSMSCVSVSHYASVTMDVEETEECPATLDGAFGAPYCMGTYCGQGEEGPVRYIDEEEAETMQEERQRHVTGPGVYHYPRFATPQEARRAQKAPRRGCIEPGAVIFTFGTIEGGVMRRTLLGRNVAQTRHANFNARVERRGDTLVVVAVDQILVFREIVVDRQWADHIAI